MLVRISTVAFILLLAAFTEAKVIERILAIVNGQIITKMDFDDYRKKLKSGGLVDDALLRMNDPKSLMSSDQALLDHLVNEKLLDSEVKRRGLEVPFERVEKEIRTITARNNIGRNELKQTLKKQGVSFAEYQDFIKTTLERQALIEREVSSKIKISDEDVAAYYASKLGGAGVYQYELAHIMFLNKNGGPAEAKKRAEAALKKLQQGQPFETLAKQLSEDPGYADNGLLGTFKSNELAPNWQGPIRELKPGDHSPVLSSKAGYHIVKVLNRVVVSAPDSDRERDRIRETLFNEAFKVQFKNWLAQLRQEAFIRIN